MKIMIPPDLVIGCAILTAIKDGCYNIDLDYFVTFRNRLNDQIDEKEYCIPSINAYDVKNVVYGFPRYMYFKPAKELGWFRDVAIYPDKSLVTEIERKLNTYYRKMLPDTLVGKVDKLSSLATLDHQAVDDTAIADYSQKAKG